jgi:hypothetical protein
VNGCLTDAKVRARHPVAGFQIKGHGKISGEPQREGREWLAQGERCRPNLELLGRFFGPCGSIGNGRQARGRQGCRADFDPEEGPDGADQVRSSRGYGVHDDDAASLLQVADTPSTEARADTLRCDMISRLDARCAEVPIMRASGLPSRYDHEFGGVTDMAKTFEDCIRVHFLKMPVNGPDPMKL